MIQVPVFPEEKPKKIIKFIDGTSYIRKAIGSFYKVLKQVDKFSNIRQHLEESRLAIK